MLRGKLSFGRLYIKKKKARFLASVEKSEVLVGEGQQWDGGTLWPFWRAAPSPPPCLCPQAVSSHSSAPWAQLPLASAPTNLSPSPGRGRLCTRKGVLLIILLGQSQVSQDLWSPNHQPRECPCGSELGPGYSAHQKWLQSTDSVRTRPFTARSGKTVQINTSPR